MKGEKICPLSFSCPSEERIVNWVECDSDCQWWLDGDCAVVVLAKAVKVEVKFTVADLEKNGVRI